MSNGAHSSDLATTAVLTVAGVAGVVWAGAMLACLVGTGSRPDVSLGDAIAACVTLPAHFRDPAGAWPEASRSAFPGPAIYWPATAATAAGVTFVVVRMWRLLAGAIGSDRRVRLGVDTHARLARVRDLAPLRVERAARGRLILGRVKGQLVATENRATTSKPGRRLRARQGDVSGVALIGPTRCGKTSNLISSVLEWEGPAVLSSVKDDLLNATLARRSSLGEVKIFDPLGVTDYRHAQWSPLQFAGTVTGALRSARALADCAPRAGAEDMNFFMSKAETLLWPLLYTASISRRSMTDVVQWVQIMDRPIGDDPGQIAPILEAESHHADATRRTAAQSAARALASIWNLDDRTRSAIYTTTQTLVQAWEDPQVCAATERCEIDLEWLIDGNNTLYICSPLHDQQRLEVLFGGVVGDLVKQSYERAQSKGAPLPEPLLLVMDEAGNTPTRWLPQVASTCAGIGMLLVTVWQSKSQIDKSYGRLADTVLTNHGTKVIYSGVSDWSTLNYVSSLLGDEEVRQIAVSGDTTGSRQTVNESAARLRLIPADVVRQARPGEALLIHGTLRPAHLVSRPYYDEPALRELAGLPPLPVSRPKAALRRCTRSLHQHVTARLRRSANESTSAITE